MKKTILLIITILLTMPITAQIDKEVDSQLQKCDKLIQSYNFNEAFKLCFNIDNKINQSAQATGNTRADLRYRVTAERLKMYNLMNHREKAEGQLERLRLWAENSNNDSLRADYKLRTTLHHTKYSTGKAQASLKEWFATLTEGKDTTSIRKEYQQQKDRLLKNKHTATAAGLTALYTSYQDSLRAAEAISTLAILRQQYNDCEAQLEEEKDNAAAAKNITYTLMAAIAILLAATLLTAAILLRYRQKNHKLGTRLSTVKSVNKNKSQFISHIHDQLSPVLKDIEEGAEKGDKEEVTSSSEALRHILGDIQSYVRLEDNIDTPYPIKQFNVQEFAESIIEEIKPAVSPGVEAVIKVPRVIISSDKHALRHILLHLLKNSALNTTEGRITLEFRKRSAHTGEFLVTDSGTGISEEKSRWLFKPFARLENIKSGSGLGLPICKLMAARLGGDLRLDTKYKKGARFILEVSSK